VPPKSLRDEARHLFERARLFEQMHSAGHNARLLFAAQLRQRLLVEPDYRPIHAADDQMRR